MVYKIAHISDTKFKVNSVLLKKFINWLFTLGILPKEIIHKGNNSSMWRI